MIAGRALPWVGHSVWFHADTSGFLTQLSREQGDIAEFRLGRRAAFLLSHPSCVEQVLVRDAGEFHKGGLIRRARRLLGNGLITSEGDVHHAQRRRVQPALATRRVAEYVVAVPGLAERVASRWSDGQCVDIGAAMDELALSVAAHALFGTVPGATDDAVRSDLALLARWFPLLALPGAGRLERLRVPPFSSAARAAARIDASLSASIAAAEHGGGTGLLRAIRGEEGGEHMASGRLRDEVMTLFLAGHDTTAAALTWLWYLLACNPSVAASLDTELESVLGGRNPEPSDYALLKYTGMVFDETVRLYPPVGRIGRRPAADYQLQGRTIPRGASVFLSPWVTQRDARWWPDPLAFEPQRWTPEAIAVRPRFAAFPFGAGPRSCVGGYFARMTAVLAVAALRQRWHFALAQGQPPRVRSLLTLKPRTPLLLRVVRR